MFSIDNLVGPVITLLSLLTLSGIIVHENQIDSVTKTALHRASEPGKDEALVIPKNKPHTHNERPPLDQAIREIRTGQPRIQPRRDDNRLNNTSRKQHKNNYSELPSDPVLEALGLS